MRKLGRPTGLIRFTSEREQQGGVRHLWRPRTLAYLAMVMVAWGTLGALVYTRADALVEVVRGGREPYRLLPTGQVANQQRIRLTNQRDETQRFQVTVVSPRDATLVLSESPIVVGPDDVVTVNAVTTVPRGVFVDGQASIHYQVTSSGGFKRDVEFLCSDPTVYQGAHGDVAAARLGLSLADLHRRSAVYADRRLRCARLGGNAARCPASDSGLLRSRAEVGRDGGGRTGEPRSRMDGPLRVADRHSAVPRHAASRRREGCRSIGSAGLGTDRRSRGDPFGGHPAESTRGAGRAADAGWQLPDARASR